MKESHIEMRGDEEFHADVACVSERVKALRSVSYETLLDGNGGKPEADSTEPDTDSREVARAMLSKQFNIESAFVRVPVLAKVLNLSPAGIYAAMRADRFFIPHRMMFSAPAVKFEDLIDWYCGREQQWAKSDGDASPSPARQPVNAQRSPIGLSLHGPVPCNDAISPMSTFPSEERCDTASSQNMDGQVASQGDKHFDAKVAFEKSAKIAIINESLSKMRKK